MKPDEIISYVDAQGRNGKQMFVTSSFQTHSIPLLHILSQCRTDILVVFINTGYLFPETISFRDHVVELLNLSIVNLRSDIPKLQQRDCNGSLYFASDPDRCCYLNKTAPMEKMLMQYDIWINGVRRDQNQNRKKLELEEKAPFGCTRFHPMLDWSNKMIYQYLKEHNLPKHPLEDRGYRSIGCEPCTQKIDLENMRDGRWFGLNKTECGLHTDLIEKA